MKVERIKKGIIKIVSTNKWEAIGVEFLINGVARIKIPDGFTFDGASVPNFSKLIGIDDDDFLWCACLHDYLYRNKAKIFIQGEIKELSKYFDYISFGKINFAYGNRKFSDLCYKTSLKYGKWIKKKNRLAKRKILYSYYILRLFGWINFRKKEGLYP